MIALHKRIRQGAAAITLGVLLAASSAMQAEAWTNAVLIVAADLGGKFGGAGQGVPTPNIDAIGASGRIAINAYASPFSTGGIAKILSGRYEQSMGIYRQPRPDQLPSYGLPVDVLTLSTQMWGASYRTGIYGKWQLGSRPQFQPMARGFQEGHYIFETNTPYFPPYTANPVYHNSVLVNETRYLTDAFGEEAADFVFLNKAAPFFLYVAFNAVHPPFQATPEQLARVPANVAPTRRPFAAVLMRMDDQVGAIRAAVADAGLLNDTIFVFVGDTGCPKTSGCLTGGMRGWKGSLYEGGVRVPLTISWPREIPAGQPFVQNVTTADIMPTILAATGADFPWNHAMDGTNLLAWLVNATVTIPRPHECVVWGPKAPSGAIRCGGWKLIAGELYNLQSDPGERHNLAARYPAKVAELRAKRLPLVADWTPPLW